MVDFKKALEESRRKGKFLGYCNYCDTNGRLHEVDILPAYRTAPDNEKKAKCPACGRFMLIDGLIPFIDREGLIGRAKTAPINSATVPATSPSRSLNSLRLAGKSIQIEINKNGYLLINTASIIGDRAKVSRTNAIKLAEWILLTYGRRESEVQTSSETLLARKSKRSK